MNPNTVFHFATLAYVQKMHPMTQDDEPMPPDWPLRLAAALLCALWNLPTALVNHGKQEQFASTPTLERAVN